MPIHPTPPSSDTISAPQRRHLRDGNPVGSERYIAATTNTESTIELITYASRIMATILFLKGSESNRCAGSDPPEYEGLSKGTELQDQKQTSAG
jgi:hypothetical protein